MNTHKKTPTLKARALSFLASNRLAILSTANADDGRPQSALVAFAEGDGLEILFGTSKSSRKYANLSKDNRVSLVIGTDHKGTMQIEGIARELSGESAAHATDAIVAKNPYSEKVLRGDEARVFSLAPVWRRVMDSSDGSVTEGLL